MSDIPYDTSYGKPDDDSNELIDHYADVEPEIDPDAPRIPLLHELYFLPEGLSDEEREAAYLKTRAEMMERVFKISNPIDAIHYQLKALDIMFHQSVFEGCSRENAVFIRDAFRAQKLYREGVKLLIRDKR